MRFIIGAHRQDEALDAEGPRAAFEKMAQEVNDLAQAAATAKGDSASNAPPIAKKTADDVRMVPTIASLTQRSRIVSSRQRKGLILCDYRRGELLR